MAVILPFEGLYYNTDRVDLSDTIAPPYDVLSLQQQEALAAQSPHNVVRLILNSDQPGDSESCSRYTRAAEFLQQSLQSGIIVQDEQPALYEYIQRFAHPLEPGRTVERHALFVALKLAPYSEGVVLPHEETHPKAKQDRLLLMRATRANPEPIYGLYEDAQGELAGLLSEARAAQPSPLLQAALPGPGGPKSEEHLVYRYTAPALLARIQEFFAPRRVWIADGHHRYETALNYQREQGGPSDTLQPHDSLLIALTAFEEPGLVVLPTHRLVKNIAPDRLAELPERLSLDFEVEEKPLEAARSWIAEEGGGKKRFVLLLAERAYALTLRGEELAEADSAGHCEAWRKLDVSILQMLALDKALGISWQELAHTPDVAYTREESEAVEKVSAGEYQAAFLLQNPAVTEVRDVAQAGDKMPQKSTFFYPKLFSGLIMRRLS